MKKSPDISRILEVKSTTVIDEKKQNTAIYGELELLIATVIAVIIGISFR